MVTVFLFFIDSFQLILKNLILKFQEKHDETSINLTDLYHRLIFKLR